MPSVVLVQLLVSVQTMTDQGTPLEGTPVTVIVSATMHPTLSHIGVPHETSSNDALSSATHTARSFRKRTRPL